MCPESPNFLTMRDNLYGKYSSGSYIRGNFMSYAIPGSHSGTERLHQCISSVSLANF